MKILYVDLDRLVKNDIIWGLVELGIDVDRYPGKVPINDIDYDEVEKLSITLDSYNIVISQNFSATIAEACFGKRIPYISWIYDSPQSQAYRKEAAYDVCYKFMFDRKGKERLCKAGIDKVYHQPLAANITMTSGLIITDDDVKRYSSDVSFVGSMYKTSYYRNLYEGLPLPMKEHFDNVVADNFCKWNGNSIYNTLNKAEIDAIYQIMNKNGLGESYIPLEYLIETLMFSIELSGKERKNLLNVASEIGDVAIYTHKPDEFRAELKGRVNPPVDSETEIYKVYYSSKINLNISLHSIETGLPQRIFDIMSVGGFVLSNYQDEIGELFNIGSDIEVYRDTDEYKEKIKYYLSHDEQRIRMGVNGYLRVKDNYTYPIILRKIIDFVCKDWGI